MYLNFSGKRIAGVVSVLPEKLYYMEDEVADPNDPKTRRLKRIIGYGSRRRAKADTTLSDMLLFGINDLLAKGLISKKEIGAIITCTLSEDYILPSISSILHGELGLDKDVLCIDSPQPCSGFAIGLIHAFMYLDHMQGKKVLLCTGEVFCRETLKTETKLEHPSFGGDIANIAVIDNTDVNTSIYCSAFFDGSGREALIIRDGGFRSPMTPDKIINLPYNRPFSAVDMDGSAVFNFVQRELPPAINDLVNRSGHIMDDIDWFIFHQPNKYMLQKLADSMRIPYNKVPMELTSSLGNSNSGTIPAVMTTYLSDSLTKNKNLVCFSGFGAGLSWVSIVMDCDQLGFCYNLESGL